MQATHCALPCAGRPKARKDRVHVMFDGDETEYWCAVQGLHKVSAPCQHLARLVAWVS